MQVTNYYLKHSSGFTYLGLMLIVAIAGIVLSGIGIMWKTEMQRENEKELRFVGEQYVAAIASYYECKVCGPNQLPKNLKDLLKDSRSPGLVRHIRKLYRDPMTRGNDWGLVKVGDRITGVYSKSKLEPLAKPYDAELEKKKKEAAKAVLAANGNQLNTSQTTTSADKTNTNSNNTGANVAGLNKTENKASLNKTGINKTEADSVIKPRKPSYQDWQFVYGGAVQNTSNQINIQSSSNLSDQNSASTLNDSQSANPNADQNNNQNRESVLEICQSAYLEATRACRAQQSIDKDKNAAQSCLQAAKTQYDDCSASIR